MTRKSSLRYLAMLLVAFMLIGMLPFTSNAAALTTSVAGLDAQYTNGTWSVSGGTTLNGQAKTSSSSGCTGTTYTAVTSTLTLKNNLSDEAVLSFDVTAINPDGGSIKIGGADGTTGSYSFALASGASIQVVLTSKSGGDGTATITMANLALAAAVSVNTTFAPAQNGSYTIDGTVITANTTLTKQSTESYAAVATAASGYKFLGWYSVTNDAYISTAATDNLLIDSDQTITAMFVSSSTPVFDVAGALFTDLGAANSYAVANSKSKITLISNGTLPSGNYEISSGKTLLIPFDDAGTLYTTTPALTLNSENKPASHVNPSAFRTLTMANGATITVKNGGAISVSGQASAVGTNATSWNGTPTGPHGRITMNSGSNIILESGANLYTWGYISGSGMVEALSGSTVYELFQLRCWRGGTASSSMADNSQKVFPFNQYYVQNIEAPLKLNAGANEKVFTAVNMSNQQFGASADFIGNSGMFRLTSGYIIKRYNGSNDRLVFDVEGNISISPLQLTIRGLPLIGTLDFDTNDYVLPINSNITINVNTGATEVKQDVALLPGTIISIANDADVSLASGKKIYVYDQDQWGAYGAGGQQLVVVGYSTVNGTTAKRTAANLVDAKIDINGTFTANGTVYTTQSGAEIISSLATGEFILAGAPGTETNTYMATQSSSDISYVSIPITAAQLKNLDGTFTQTAGSAAGTEIPYVVNRWGAQPIEVIIDKNDGSGTTQNLGDLSGTQQISALTAAAVQQLGWTRDGWTLYGWSESADGSTTVWVDGDTLDIDRNYTLYAQWRRDTFTASFDANQGTGAINPITSNTAYEVELPDGDALSRDGYHFTGWNTKANGTGTGYNAGDTVTLTDDTTFYAQWAINTYTITWNDDQGNLLKTTTVNHGATPSYGTPAPTKPSDAQYDYTFAGWDPAVVAATGDATYTAQFTPGLRSYTVTWVIEGEEETTTVAYGAHPEHADPEKEANAKFTYTFAGWYTDMNYNNSYGIETETVTGPGLVLYAKFDETINQYHITFKNYDGSILEEQDVDYDEVPVYSGVVTPTKPSDVQFDYTFAGEWTPALTAVTGDAEYTAVFTASTRSYDIEFRNWDGELLATVPTLYGELPDYDGAEPERPADELYTYTFAGWDPAITEVTGEATYTATFTPVVITHEITFYPDGGEGEPFADTYDGVTPKALPGVSFTYEGHTQVGWSTWPNGGGNRYELGEEATFTNDMPLYAVWETNTYTITWNNYDGSLIAEDTFAYGETPAPSVSTTPEKPADAQYIYTFAGWSPEIEAVTGDAVYTATFTGTLRSYEITFNNWNGMPLYTETFDYGEIPVYGGATPEKPADAQYTYVFAGWDPAVVAVEGEATYTAAFTSNVNTYTVTWQNDNGDEIDVETYEYGEIPTFKGSTPEKAATAEYTYTFAGWTPAIDTVTGNATYIATYDAAKNTYTVTWKNGNDVIDTETYEYGETPTFKGETPEKAATPEYTYTFAGWDPAIAEVTGDAEYTAEFTAAKNTYTVTWYGLFGAELATETYEYGETPAYDAPVAVDMADGVFNFKGWDPAIETVTGDAEYYAIYSYTGWIFDDTFARYYQIDDETQKTGWTEIDGNYYYLDPETGAAATGIKFVPYKDGYGPNAEDLTDSPAYTEAGYDTKSYFIFDANGVFQADTNGFVDFDGETKWAVNGELPWHVGLVTDGTDYYYFARSGMVAGQDYYVVRTNDLPFAVGTYTFDADGKMIVYDGIVDIDGTLYYYVNGVKTYAGLILIGNDYYYVRSSGQLAVDCDYYVVKTNDLLPVAKYHFDEEGKLVKDGIYRDSDGVLRYYKLGKPYYAGLIEIDGNYYYVTRTGELAVERHYVVVTNDIMPMSWHDFDENGVMTDYVAKNGIVAEDDGLYYYENGVKVYRGLFELNGDYYYANSSGKIVTGRYYVVKHNDLVEMAYYEFDNEGKMINATIGGNLKNGIIRDEDDVLRYYVDGALNYAGLIEVDGNLYYVRSNGELAIGRYYVVKHNGLLSDYAWKNFDENGVMVD